MMTNSRTNRAKSATSKSKKGQKTTGRKQTNKTQEIPEGQPKALSPNALAEPSTFVRIKWREKLFKIRIYKYIGNGIEIAIEDNNDLVLATHRFQALSPDALAFFKQDNVDRQITALPQDVQNTLNSIQ
jgi:hypothetical protein